VASAPGGIIPGEKSPLQSSVMVPAAGKPAPWRDAL